MNRILLICVMALVLTGCRHRYLSCRSEYLYPDYLAAEQINTPDPCRPCFWGQQIVMKWSLPKHCLTSPITLQLHIRYVNREVETLSFPVTTLRGWRIHRLVNQAYWTRGGVLSYQAELIQNGQILDTWTHSLWADLIELTPELN